MSESLTRGIRRFTSVAAQARCWGDPHVEALRKAHRKGWVSEPASRNASESRASLESGDVDADRLEGLGGRREEGREPKSCPSSVDRGSGSSAWARPSAQRWRPVRAERSRLFEPVKPVTRRESERPMVPMKPVTTVEGRGLTSDAPRKETRKGGLA